MPLNAFDLEPQYLATIRIEKQLELLPQIVTLLERIAVSLEKQEDYNILDSFDSYHPWTEEKEGVK